MDDTTTLSTFSDLLKAFRKQRKITQQELASRLGIHRNTIGMWENGSFLPESKTIVLELARQLHLDAYDMRRLLEASLTALSPYWHVPYQRNPFFTGREDVLHQLHDTLAQKGTAVISQSYSLSGLGGIGKTQTAIEYAYRHANDYAAVFWISAETNESIVSSFVAIAELLNLPEKQEKEQNRVLAAVTRWLNSHSDWLIIFDNVEDLELVKTALPSARCGSLLFTSRRQALGFSAHTLGLEQMPSEEGMRFLLHRARLLAPEASLGSLTPEDVAFAREIVAAMAGLPLALDQASAYIEETRCSLSDYLQLFQSSQLRMLDERDTYADHPSSVIRTFALAFEQLEQNNPASAELLTVCAFLAPEAIPETFFTEGAEHLGPTFERLAADSLAFQTAIKALLTYSLIQRDTASRTMTIHRLVQAVLKGRLPEADERIWVTRVIRAMSQLFPSEAMQANYWQDCQKLLSHALVCITLGEQWGEGNAFYTILISHVAIYLSHRARYAEAKLLYEQALQIGEHTLGSEHLLVAKVLHGLAVLYKRQGNFREAKPLYERSLRIREQARDPLVAELLNSLAELYREQGKYQEAEPFYKRALVLGESALGAEHPLIAEILNDLAILSWQQGKNKEAKPLYERALYIWQQVLGPEHPQIAHPLYGLAILYAQQGEYEEAESLFQRALHIRERALGPEHPQMTYPLHGLAELYKDQGKYEEAEPLFQRALHIRERALGPEHPQMTYPLHGLAELYREQGKYEEAESLFQRALHIRERALGPEHLQLAYLLHGLAELYREQGKYEEAESLFQRVLQIREQGLGAEHLLVAETLYELAKLFRDQGNRQEALSLAARALEISVLKLGNTHATTVARRAFYEQLLLEQAISN